MDSTGWQSGSIFGGCLSIVLGIIMILLAQGAFLAIWEAHDSEMAKRIDMFDEEKRPGMDGVEEIISFEAFQESLNVVFGLAVYDESWDPLNNPYVVYKGQMISNGMKLTNSLDLHVCPDEEKARYIPEVNFGWYPKAICIRNKEDAVIHKNWFMLDYDTPTISVSYCKNTTENGNFCKSKDEIDLFLRNTSAFFVHMSTYV